MSLISTGSISLDSTFNHLKSVYNRFFMTSWIMYTDSFHSFVLELQLHKNYNLIYPFCIFLTCYFICLGLISNSDCMKMEELQKLMQVGTYTHLSL
jgi:hypothetical protein